MQRAFYQPHSGGPESDRHLPAWVYYAAALFVASIGLCASYVNVEFLVIAIRSREPDPEIQKILGLVGVLFVLAEIAAFGLAGLLPIQRLRELRLKLVACGIALVLFEVASIYVSQATITRTTDVAAAARTARIEQLQAAITSQRQAASGLRENAARQNESRHAWIRQGAVDSLREAVSVERSIAPLANELAQLQSTQRPTVTDVLGEQGTLAMNLAVAILTTSVGLLMLGVAGALVRVARNCRPPLAPVGGDGGQPAPAPVDSPNTSSTAASTTAPRAHRTRKSTRPRVGGNVVAFPAASAADAAGRAGASTVNSTDSSASALVDGTVLVEAQCARGEKSAGKARGRAATTRAASTVPDGHKLDTGVEGESGHRYRRVRDGVMSGEIKPSVRSIQNAVGGGTLVARRYLQALVDEGVIQKAGQGYELAKGRIAA